MGPRSQMPPSFPTHMLNDTVSTAPVLAEVYKVHPRTIRNWILREKLPSRPRAIPCNSIDRPWIKKLIADGVSTVNIIALTGYSKDSVCKCRREMENESK